MPEYVAGLDLGQAQDYSALAIAELREADSEQMERRQVGMVVGQKGQPAPRYEDVPVQVRHYDLRHLERFPLNTSYPAIVATVAQRLQIPALAHHTRLAVDGTGVGRPVVDLLVKARLPVQLTAVGITGGHEVTSDGIWRMVPKRDLVSTVQVLLQSGRLHIAAQLPEAETLTRELQNFQVKITTAANDTYGAWREGTHDDLVLATALACWLAEARTPARFF